MINLKLYAEWCAELVNRTNQNCEYKIDSMRLAVSEAHMVKKLGDAKGIILCASYPDARGTESLADLQQGFFFIVEKVAQGADSKNEEMARYARLQEVMIELRDQVIESKSECMQMHPENDYKVEWEWQVFGGYNGLSLGFKFRNYD